MGAAPTAPGQRCVICGAPFLLYPGNTGGGRRLCDDEACYRKQASLNMAAHRAKRAQKRRFTPPDC